MQTKIEAQSVNAHAIIAKHCNSITLEILDPVCQPGDYLARASSSPPIQSGAAV